MPRKSYTAARRQYFEAAIHSRHAGKSAAPISFFNHAPASRTKPIQQIAHHVYDNLARECEKMGQKRNGNFRPEDSNLSNNFSPGKLTRSPLGPMSTMFCSVLFCPVLCVDLTHRWFLSSTLHCDCPFAHSTRLGLWALKSSNKHEFASFLLRLLLIFLFFVFYSFQPLSPSVLAHCLLHGPR